MVFLVSRQLLPCQPQVGSCNMGLLDESASSGHWCMPCQPKQLVAYTKDEMMSFDLHTSATKAW